MTAARVTDATTAGSYTFFNYAISSSTGNGWRHTRHGDCDAAADALREMPIQYDHAIQALVEISELLGSHIARHR